MPKSSISQYNLKSFKELDIGSTIVKLSVMYLNSWRYRWFLRGINHGYANTILRMRLNKN